MQAAFSLAQLYASALVASVLAKVLPVAAHIAGVRGLELLIDLYVGGDLLGGGPASVVHVTVFTPTAGPARCDLGTLNPQLEGPVVQHPAVDPT